MNLKLLLQLSLFGLAMAIGTVFVIPANIEPAFWLAIFVICAYIIAKNAASNYFLHGFVLSLFNSVWITAFHIAFYDNYIANNPQMLEMNANMPMPDQPRLMMLIMGPVFGAIFGLILGLFAFIAGKLVKK